MSTTPNKKLEESIMGHPDYTWTEWLAAAGISTTEGDAISPEGWNRLRGRWRRAEDPRKT